MEARPPTLAGDLVVAEEPAGVRWLLRQLKGESRSAAEVVMDDALVQDDGIDLIVAELNRCWEVTQDQDKASKIEKAQFETKRDAKSETTFMLCTHSLVARTFFGTTRAQFFCAHFAHIFLRVTHTHGSRTRKGVLCAYVVSLLISPSPFSCCIRRPCCSCTVTSRRRTFQTQKRGSSALCTRMSSFSTWPRTSPTL